MHFECYVCDHSHSDATDVLLCDISADQLIGHKFHTETVTDLVNKSRLCHAMLM